MFFFAFPLGEQAKAILRDIKPTPYNQEIINSWIEVAVVENIWYLYNTI